MVDHYACMFTQSGYKDEQKMLAIISYLKAVHEVQKKNNTPVGFCGKRLTRTVETICWLKFGKQTSRRRRVLATVAVRDCEPKRNSVVDRYAV